MRRNKLRATGVEWLLVKRSDRSTVSIKYRRCPRSPWQWGSSGVRTKKAASKVAAGLVQRWLADKGRDVLHWSAFRERYESEGLAGLAAKTQEAFRTAANRLEALCPVQYVQDLDAATFSRFAFRLRNEAKPKAESTIQAYRDHLMMALGWAKEVGIIEDKPKPKRLKRAKRASSLSRGRPITREEAERIAMKLPGIVGDENAKVWAWNLEALWRSGMRIAETFALSWEQSDGHYILDLDGRRPMLAISAEHEKGFRDRLVPITPDFASLLRDVPAANRKGLVFRWPGKRGGGVTLKTVEKRIAEAGRLARVVVHRAADGTERYATAHDWRRSFGASWSTRVMPIVLQQLMRHESIETTMRYYVGKDARRVADAIWDQCGHDLGAKLGDMLDSLHAVGPADGAEPA